MAEKSATQRIQELDDERALIFEQAKEELLEKANEVVAQLNALGLHYTLTNGAGRGKAKVAKATKRTITEMCPICEFQTNPPHDGRTHRSQKKKIQFSATALKEKGLERV
jgi:hypothetical protein